MPTPMWRGLPTLKRSPYHIETRSEARTTKGRHLPTPPRAWDLPIEVRGPGGGEGGKFRLKDRLGSLTAGQNMRKVFKKQQNSLSSPPPPSLLSADAGPQVLQSPPIFLLQMAVLNDARCGPYAVEWADAGHYVAWASHVEAKPIPHRNMKRSPHHIGLASAHSGAWNLPIEVRVLGGSPRAGICR